MNINISTGSLKGFQTTDGGFKYRRVQAVTVGSSNQTGLLEVESKYTTDGKGIGRLLVRAELPYFTANTAACCCDDSGTSPTFAQAGKIVYHTVLTLPKAAVSDVKSENAVLAANQISAIIGLALGMSNTFKSSSDPSDALASFDKDGKLEISTTTDINGILDPSRAVIRGVMGVTPIPAEGFNATTSVTPMVG